MENSMAVADGRAMGGFGTAPATIKRLSLYWLATIYIVLTSFWGGVAAILHAPPLFDEVLRLGYPPHFSSMLGVWKVLGAMALTIPRRPLLKEWAYAGMFIDVTAAMVAYAAVGDGVSSFIGPIVWLGALLASWQLRPASRRLVALSSNAD
jgi:hypothetical protein